MKIRTLNLIAFGKFQNKTIEVSDGLNLVFGANEAGKTTIQHFVEGMLFGFYKPYRKKRTFNEDYYRFKPRNGNAYFGSMVIEDDNERQIRIERDFLKTRDGVRIYDNLTGEDISENYPYDSVNKQYLPVGNSTFNSVLYNNTVNVKQLASRSGEDLSKEVNDRLIAMAEDDLVSGSINSVLEYVGERKRRIGTVGKSKTPYGKAVKEIADLEKVLFEGEEDDRLIRENQKKILLYKERLAKVDGEYEEIKSRIDQTSVAERREIEKKILELRCEMNEIQQKIEKLRGHECANREIYVQLKVLESNLSAIEERKAKLDEQVRHLEDEQAGFSERCRQIEESFHGLSREEIENDYQTYRRNSSQSLVAAKADELYSDSDSETEAFSETEEEETLQDRMFFAGMNPIVLIMGLIIGLAIGVYGIINPGNILTLIPRCIVIILGIILVLGIVGCFVLRKRELVFIENMPDDGRTGEMDDEDQSMLDEAVWQQVGFENTNHKIDQNNQNKEWIMSCPVEDDATEDLTETEDDKTSVRQRILDKYYCDSEEAYEVFISKCRTIFERYEHLKMSEDDLSKKIEELHQERDALIAESSEYQSLIDEALSLANSDSIETYGLLCEGNDAIERLEMKLEADQRLYEEWSEQLNRSSNVYFLSDEDTKVKELQDAIMAYRHEIDRLSGENQSLMDKTANPVAVRERIETLKNETDQYESDLQACEMVERFFKDYVRRVHSDSAPNVNGKIGDIIYRITNKYRDIMIDDQMNIRVLDPESDTLLSLSQLSGGTIDQLSLALRFGIADLFDQNASMPLLLDDPFVQYDDFRKAEAVKYLSKIADQKQIMLFTCTADEKHILDENHLRYMGIGI